MCFYTSAVVAVSLELMNSVCGKHAGRLGNSRLLEVFRSASTSSRISQRERETLETPELGSRSYYYGVRP